MHGYGTWQQGHRSDLEPKGIGSNTKDKMKSAIRDAIALARGMCSQTVGRAGTGAMKGFKIRGMAHK